MNILQILPAMEIGGVETGTLDLARYLVAHGHKAVIVSGGGRLVKELEALGARHHTLPVGRKSPFTIFRMVGELCDIIRREDIDIVHARSRVPGLIAYIACRMTDRVFITTAHGYYRKGLISSVMSWGRFVIVASNIMAKYMARDFHVPYGRIRLIPRGVDLSQFKFRDPASRNFPRHESFIAVGRGPAPRLKSSLAGNSFTIGMVSRITPLKGHADFIRGIAIVAREVPNIKVLIAGAAPKDKYKEDLEFLVRGLGLSQTVEFVGPKADVPSFMQGLDLLVSATTAPEAFGRVVIEAQASGIPVVATKVGGVVDIVEDGVTGLLCMASNPEDMAVKIMRLYRDRQLWMDVATESRRRVELDFNVDVMMERTIAVYHEALERQNILVIKMSATGDVILGVPSLKSIRVRYPKADIKVLVGLAAREVLDRCPYIDGMIVCDFKDKHRALAGLWRLGAELREHCFDIVIDLQNNRKSHILAYLSMAPFRYGYDNGKLSFLLNRRQKDDAPYLDPLDHQFRTLRLAGIKPVDKTLELWPSEYDKTEAEKILADSWIQPTQNLVGIAVRASARWHSKNWPPSCIVQLCDRLARELNVRVVLTGSKDDMSLADYIMKRARSKPIDAVGKTDLSELAALIRHFKVFVTPDSAPMHVATAMNVPVVALFGPTDPARHFVPGRESVVLRRNDEVKCEPCYKPTCSRKVSCMKRIAVDDLFAAVKNFIKVPHESPEHIDSL